MDSLKTRGLFCTTLWLRITLLQRRTERYTIWKKWILKKQRIQRYQADSGVLVISDRETYIKMSAVFFVSCWIKGSNQTKIQIFLKVLLKSTRKIRQGKVKGQDLLYEPIESWLSCFREFLMGSCNYTEKSTSNTSTYTWVFLMLAKIAKVYMYILHEHVLVKVCMILNNVDMYTYDCSIRNFFWYSLFLVLHTWSML